MSGARTFLSSFTPSLMAPETLEALFVQQKRHELAKRLLHDIRQSAITPAKRHTLLVGPRGIGKTHLISLLYHRIRSREENADLDRQLCIAWLKEEERGVRSFGHLVRRILESLAAEYRDEGLKRQTEALLDSPQDFEERGEQLLTSWLAGRTLLLLAENFDDLLRRIGLQGQQRFRAYLQNEGNTMLLVTATALDQGLSAHEAPFYGFFNVDMLLELEAEDAAELLEKIAKWRQDTDLIAFLKTPTARNRLRVIEALAGGHPRIWILFAGVLTRDTLDELVPLFLEMLDDLTPYYQARLDSLSPQQAQVVECLIEKRRAVPVWEIARYCLMEPNSVSVQLRLLGEMGYVRNDRLGRVAYYELREPLMRLCLEVKESRGKPIRIIVDFLQRWYDRNELKSWLSLCRLDSRYEHGRDMCRGLLMHAEEYLLWRERIATLVELYHQHGVLAEIGMGMVRAIPALFAPTVTDTVADAWNAAWQAAGKGYDTLEIPLRLLDAAVRWRVSCDPAVMLSLPAEERPILQELLREGDADRELAASGRLTT